MTTTTEVARAHGYTGPLVCRDCATTVNLHLIVWANPETGESGTALECCACGIAAGDPSEIHDDCEPDEPGSDDLDEPDPGPVVRVFCCDAGWVMTGSEPEACTTNFHREQDGRPACTDIAAWKVVEDHGMHLSIGFYCDADLPAQYRPREGSVA
ncbi:MULTISPECIES: hypothetical protein [unclassified Streptomyces]|uniref:hypothetical protein n=1 Tax=unclassified Streptomyces TaxID=2593676 RepID=UPI0022507DD1|nr:MULTISPECIES: hypothetical protein [unclassified Streptomyces]MCX4863493.1 hypothetical protein [Streptomyces sp. NBC_00906]MCX4894731.1 hypothetical protein [Streptomyces sp. NBC_00892]